MCVLLARFVIPVLRGLRRRIRVRLGSVVALDGVSIPDGPAQPLDQLALEVLGLEVLDGNPLREHHRVVIALSLV
jgi:hypothetical protein